MRLIYHTFHKIKHAIPGQLNLVESIRLEFIVYQEKLIP